MQVVGTNGKGTTSLALASAFEEMGYSTGVYLSPHVMSYTERVVIGGNPVSEEDFAAAMGETIDLADRHGIPVSQFELLTAGALKMFADAGLSWSVLEAGLGARYDATSVVEPDAVVLTNVALDHTQYLGVTIEEIAREKLANVRPKTKLFVATSDPTVLEVANQRAEQVGARMIEISGVGEEEVEAFGLVPYAARNVALAFVVAESLLGREISHGARKRAASRVVGALPARFERYEVRGVPVVVDGGHNVAGLDAALDAVRSVYPDRPLGVVFGVLKDKDIVGMLSRLSERAQVLVLTRPDNERAADPEWIEREHGPRDLGGRRARVETDAGDALAAAVAEIEELGGVVLVTGSLYTGARVLGGLRRRV